MNQIQEAIARVTGLDDVISTSQQQYSELSVAMEALIGQNALLQREIEDIDYLNLFTGDSIDKVISFGDRKKTLKRLRRMRHENPLAKQSVNLIKRFTLGKGVELIIGPDPSKAPPASPDAPAGPKVNGLFPGNRPAPNTSLPPLARPRPQVSEAADVEADGPEPAPEGEDSDPIKDIVLSFWRDPDNKLALTSRSAMSEWLDGIITDGEKFFVCFEGSAEPYVKLTELPVDEIDNIIYDPNNRLKPVYYRRQFQEMEYDGNAETYKPVAGNSNKTLYYLDWRIGKEEIGELKKRIKIPAKKLAPEDQRIYHSYINPLWTDRGKRGISELYASREWFRVYKEFMEDRAAINAAATSVAYKRKIKGGPTEVARFQNKLGGLNVGYESEENTTEISKLTRPAGAGIYDSNPAVDLEWMKTDTGAVNAEKDGRGLLSAAGAGVGMFIHYYGEGGDANLATAQAMELPMVKTFEDWQQWVEDTLRDLCFYVIKVANDEESAENEIDRIAGNFPPIISQDVVKYMTAWSQLVQNVASGNKVIRKEAIKGALTVMNVPNIDSIMNEVDAEEKALEVQRQQMMNQLANQPPPVDGNGGPKPARNGNGNALPPDLKTVAAGRTPPDRNGPKPAR